MAKKNKKRNRNRSMKRNVLIVCIEVFCCLGILALLLSMRSGLIDVSRESKLSVQATPTVDPSITSEPTVTPKPTASPTPMPTEEPEPTEEPVLETRTVMITAVGDCTLGGDTSNGGYERFESVARKNGPDYFFQNVRSIFEADDLTIINLEGPLTNEKKKHGHKYYRFRGHPEYTQLLTGSSVELCNLANNHAQDYGSVGVKDTKAALTEAGIAYSGLGEIYYTEINGIRVASVGFWWEESAKTVLATMKEARANCDLLIASMHCGVEHVHDVRAVQKKAGRALIDAGADVVLGTHPHEWQGLELYKGKYIVYSLGNFCFGGNSNPTDKDTFIYREQFTFDSENNLVDTAIDIIPARVCTSNTKNDFCPRLLEGSAAKTLLRKIANGSIGSVKNFNWLPDSMPVQLGIAKAK